MGLERLAFAFEKDVETQKGTGLLIFRPWTVPPGPRVPPCPPPATPSFLSAAHQGGGGGFGPTVLSFRGPQHSPLLLRQPPSPLTSSPGSQKMGLAAGQAETLEGSIERNWDDPTGCLSARLALGP